LCVFFWCEGNINQTKTPHNEVKQGRTLSDTRYSAKGTNGKWRYASSKARLKCATYRR